MINKLAAIKGHCNHAGTTFTWRLAEGKVIHNVREGLLLRHSNSSNELNTQSREKQVLIDSGRTNSLAEKAIQERCQLAPILLNDKWL